MTPRVLLARIIGWMIYYGSLDDDADRLIGGGSWNDENLGGEVFNFKPVGRSIYGYVQGGASGRLALHRMDRSIGDDCDELKGVTVIFVATDTSAPPHTERQRIVGWYKTATVHKEYKDDPTGVRGDSFYNLISLAKDAVLLPTHLRKHAIPRAKPGAMGQSNVWYPLEDNGEPKDSRWLAKALSYVDSYHGENLIKTPEAEIAQAAQSELEKGVGFESDSRTRQAVEQHAMGIVRQHYEALHYKVEDKYKTHSYDFECTKAGRLRYVEVKGTRTSGRAVLLTPNEIRLTHRKGAVVDLCVVHSVKVRGGKNPACSGGILALYTNWHPRDHKLRPVSYMCELSIP